MSLEEEKNKLLDLFEEVLSGDASRGGKEEKESLPYQMLDLPDGKDLYVLDPVKKKMVRAKHMTEVVQISLPDEKDRVLVKSSSGNFLYIPLEYVEDIGFN
tara:strand:- start:64 stop:366 length:303 start_codon:yes stop_codon:yes gene_type:complete